MPVSPAKSANEGAQVRLVREDGRQHIAHHQHLGIQPASVCPRRFDRLQRKLAQRGVPVLANRCLSNACH